MVPFRTRLVSGNLDAFARSSVRMVHTWSPLTRKSWAAGGQSAVSVALAGRDCGAVCPGVCAVFLETGSVAWPDFKSYAGCVYSSVSELPPLSSVTFDC